MIERGDQRPNQQMYLKELTAPQNYVDQNASEVQSLKGGNNTDLESIVTTQRLQKSKNEQQKHSRQDSTSTIAAQKQQRVEVLEYTEVFVWGEDRDGQLGIDSQLM